MLQLSSKSGLENGCDRLALLLTLWLFVVVVDAAIVAAAADDTVETAWSLLRKKEGGGGGGPDPKNPADAAMDDNDASPLEPNQFDPSDLCFRWC